MGLFSLDRWRNAFRGEPAESTSKPADDRAPDATVDEVGAAGPGTGFHGGDLEDPSPGNGYGSSGLSGLSGGA